MSVGPVSVNAVVSAGTQIRCVVTGSVGSWNWGRLVVTGSAGSVVSADSSADTKNLSWELFSGVS